ncbi:MAG: ABC transporter ATP-binding protein [Firmicutes bacterium]|jgi:branched-chain amino acid transport system ATP-binding protein|nr:ABC transporter ATP-binding protein [Bacillota bacterium]
MLRVENLSAGYDGVPVLFDVSFEVGEGEIVAIVGSNGAGKTTILRTVSGLMKPMGGNIEFRGRAIGGLPAHVITTLGLAHVPEGRRLFAKMSVRDNLLLGAHSISDEKLTASTLAEVCEIFPILGERADQKADTLSGGEQQMLAIARGLMCRPKLLMVDETSLGLMPTMVDRVFDVLKSISERGVTVLMVEQKVEKSLKMADRAYVLQTGRVVMEGTGQELLENPEIKKAYLGL